MIRLILTTIILTMLAQPVLAVDTGALLKQCKPFANNGYSFDGLSETQLSKATICKAFISGILHHAFAVCQSSTHESSRVIFGTSIRNTDVAIQMFLNWAEDNPNKWDRIVIPPFWLMETCEKTVE